MPVSFDPVLTIVSLLIASAGVALGFAVAVGSLTQLAAAIGGSMVGLAIAAMHYTGRYDWRWFKKWLVWRSTRPKRKAAVAW